MNPAAGQNIFKKVGASERKQLLVQVCDEAITLLVKLDDKVVNVLPRKIVNEIHVVCSFPSEFEIEDTDSSLVSFHIGTERYFLNPLSDVRGTCSR